MKAATINSYAGEIEITNVPTPTVSADTLLVEVHSASLNPIDNILRAGHLKDLFPITFPHVMGYDLSGVVIDVGKNVSKFKLGDAVYARPGQGDAGSLAEFAIVNERELALKPHSISHKQAASIPLAGLTAWQAIRVKAALKKGQKILIHAGSGGVGTLAIQIAKHVGAYVATTVSKDNIDLVRSLGADLAIDYKASKFEDAVADYDVVFDMIGGETLARSFQVVKEGGCVVSIKGQDEEENADKFGVRFEWFLMSPDGEQLAELSALIDARAIRPVIDSTFPLSLVSEAYDHLADGHAVGKIIVTVK